MSDEVDDFLEHFGIPGMKWGHRKSTSNSSELVKRQTESRTIKLKNGDELVLNGDRTPILARGISRLSPAIKQRINDSHNFTLKTSSGKDVGEMSIYKKKPGEMNVIWVEVEPKYRGNGYASGAMRAAVEVAKQQKLNKVTLEVPGLSPDARHIYEKMGFVAGKQITSSGDMWGGLTEMELKL